MRQFEPPQLRTRGRIAAQSIAHPVALGRTIETPRTFPTSNRRWAVWLASPSTAAAEIARQIDYGAVVLDIEHGTFDLADLDRLVPFLKSIGLDVIAKVLGPERGPI
jgi:hypothetical protein